jgi:hypothetical protein
MKSFVALSCLLVVASASADSYYYNSAYPKYQRKYGYKPVAAPVAAPAVKAVQVAEKVADPVASEFGFGDLSSLSSLGALAGIDFSSLGSLTSLMSFLPSAKSALAGLDKASDSLDNLSRGLPSALAQLDPAVKADIAKVNVIIAEVCNKIMAEATPSTFSYYSPEGIKATCNVINKTANDIVLGLDDPSIIQSYVDKVQGLTRSLQAQAAIYSNFFE